MFAAPKEILRAREGTLAETPLPLLLNALRVEEESCLLELRVRQLEKKIWFEEGAPVACASNLLHETLGKFLVERKKIEEAQYQQALAESVQTGVQMGELLVRKQLISPFDLYKQLQANLALKILDTFRWVEAKYRIVYDAEPTKSPIRVNTPQLVLTGCGGLMPFDAVAAQFVFSDEQRFALRPDSPLMAELKLSAKDTRIVQALRARPTFSELCAASKFETEAALRRLYALCVIGLADFADAVSDKPAAMAPSSPTPMPVEPAAPSGLPFADDDEATKNALISEFLELRKRDPFDLLEVPETTVQPAVFRKAFLAKADRFAPVRFKSPELREKAEALLSAWATAFGQLCDSEMLATHRKRRQLAVEQKKAASEKKSTAAEQFRIRTDLLDASTQFDEGKRRLAAGRFKEAIDYFTYACDIEPRARHKAYLALARFRQHPQFAGNASLGELAQAQAQEPDCEEAWAFAGDIHLALGESQPAEECYRKAFKLNPGERRYPEAIKSLSKRSR